MYMTINYKIKKNIFIGVMYHENYLCASNTKICGLIIYISGDN